MRAIVCLAALAALPPQAFATPHTAGSWNCSFTEEQRCDPGRDCAAMAAGTTATLWEEGGLYLSCTPQECIPSRASFEPQGDRMTIHVADFGAVLSLSPDLQLTEVSTIGQLVFVRRGLCSEGPPPKLTRSSR
jgi:hypothetical protein